jgi:nucleoside diphosphate kinase
MERTFAIIKPDAMRNGKSEAIMRDVQDAGMFQFREDFV